MIRFPKSFMHKAAPADHSVAAAANGQDEAAAGLSRGDERVDLLWRSALGGLALAAGISVQSHAAPVGLQGEWDMSAATSHFREDVTGPAPDQAVMVVSRDDPSRFVYRLVERRRGVEVARGAYNLFFQRASSTSELDGEAQPVAASRTAAGDVEIQARAVGALHAVIRVRRTGADTAVVEHLVDGPQGEIEVERFSMVRRKAVAQAAPTPSPTSMGGANGE